ncbi:hypothetical protein R3P38DRAFT_2774413 [Favolaschia claudopus]|uniref:Uncharacterized protein n=1 Tax=Favolaschia claudopus TaxID=2862362 RepID=A0AAW0BYS9_9AGAR
MSNTATHYNFHRDVSANIIKQLNNIDVIQGFKAGMLPLSVKQLVSIGNFSTFSIICLHDDGGLLKSTTCEVKGEDVQEEENKAGGRECLSLPRSETCGARVKRRTDRRHQPSSSLAVSPPASKYPTSNSAVSAPPPFYLHRTASRSTSTTFPSTTPRSIPPPTTSASAPLPGLCFKSTDSQFASAVTLWTPRLISAPTNTNGNATPPHSQERAPTIASVYSLHLPPSPFCVFSPSVSHLLFYPVGTSFARCTDYKAAYLEDVGTWNISDPGPNSLRRQTLWLPKADELPSTAMKEFVGGVGWVIRSGQVMEMACTTAIGMLHGTVYVPVVVSTPIHCHSHCGDTAIITRVVEPEFVSVVYNSMRVGLGSTANKRICNVSVCGVVLMSPASVGSLRTLQCQVALRMSEHREARRARRRER